MTSSELYSFPVELVCAVREPPLRARALLTSFTARACSVRTDIELPRLPPETTVTLRLEDRRATEVSCRIIQQTGRDLELRVTAVHHPEKRYFPREYGGIDVRWKRLDHAGREAAIHAWRKGLFAIDGDGWNTPEPYMNFSASGLRFRDKAPCSEGDLLLVTFRVQGQAVWHRAAATVVRRTQTDDGASPEIAVTFDDIPTDAVEALADFTLDRQLTELARHGLGAE